MRRFAAALAVAVVPGCLAVLDLEPPAFFVGAGEAGILDPAEAGGGDGGVSSLDAQSPAPACDTSKPWAVPEPVPALNGLTPSSKARLSADQLTVYFSAGTPLRLYTATRSSVREPFVAPTLLPMEGGQDFGTLGLGSVAVSPDGLVLFFGATAGAKTQIYAATRVKVTERFSAGTIVAALADDANTGQPFMRSDGSELYFVSSRAPAIAGSDDVFRATLTATGVVGPIEHVIELASEGDDRAPVLSADGLTIYISNRRSADGGVAATDITWTASRANDRERFSGLAVVDAFASEGEGYNASWISPDGCTLYLTRSRGAATLIYSSVRTK